LHSLYAIASHLSPRVPVLFFRCSPPSCWKRFDIRHPAVFRPIHSKCLLLCVVPSFAPLLGGPLDVCFFRALADFPCSRSFLSFAVSSFFPEVKTIMAYSLLCPAYGQHKARLSLKVLPLPRIRDAVRPVPFFSSLTRSLFFPLLLYSSQLGVNVVMPVLAEF